MSALSGLWPRAGQSRPGTAAMALLLALVALPVGPAGPGLTARAAAGGGPALLVVDGSGSMWGKLGEAPKIEAAQGRLRQLLPGYEGRMSLGLMAYGHRRKGDCRDIETLVPPGPLAPADFDAAATSINPRGKTPMSSALRQAAEVLGPGRSTILLLTDGAENCRQDPCATVRELKSQNAALSIHVIGMAIESGDLPRIRCIAEGGGGRLTLVASADELGEALSRAFDEIAAPPAPVAAAVPEVEAPPLLRLAASLAEGGAPLAVGPVWRVLPEGGGTPVAESGEAKSELAVPPGRYEVEARLGKLVRRVPVEVAAHGPTDVLVGLQAGILSVRALTKDGATAGEDVFLAVYRTDPNSGETLETVAVARGSVPAMVLPSGTYQVVAEQGHARQVRTLAVAEGREVSEEITMQVGRLRLEARGTEAGERLGEVTFSVSEDDPDIEGGVREVARSAAPDPVFVLRAGIYHVSARVGAAEVRRDVTVGADAETSEVLVLGAGTILLATRLEGQTELLADYLTYEVKRLDSLGVVVEQTSKPRPAFSLAAGSYLVASRYGPANAVASREITVAPGRSQEIVLELAGAMVELKPAAGTAPRDVLWKVADDSGRILWMTGETAPSVPLAAGSYVATLEHRGGRGSRSFEVVAGQPAVIEIPPE